MWVRMVRPVVAGRQPRQVNAVVELSEAEAQMLILAGSAVASAPPPLPATGTGNKPPHLAGVEHAVDTGVLTAERRNETDWGEMLVSGLDGIGSVIASRLAAAQIETVAELLAADPAEVARIASVRPERVEKWRQRAAAVMRGDV